MELAAKIVMFYEVLRNRYSRDAENPEIEHYVALAHKRYGELKKHMDFSSSARQSEIEAITLMLEEHHGMTDRP